MTAKLSKNQQALRLVLEECGQSLGRTRLQKALFLADYEARRRLGRPITTYEYKFWHQGPFTQQISEDVESLEALGLAKEHLSLLTRWGRPSHYYSVHGHPPNTSLDASEAVILTAAARRCSQGRQRIDALLRDIYATPPMEWAQRHGRGVRIPMEMFNEDAPEAIGVNLERIERSEREFAEGRGEDLRGVLDELYAAHFSDGPAGPF